jgi:hypothetical protein
VKPWRHWFLFAAVAWIAGRASLDAQEQGQPQAKELRVLFIGNSQIYSNELPRTLEALAESAARDRPRIKAGQFTPGGASLESLWNKGADQGSARAKIAEAKWDFVVLQEHFNAKPDSFNKYAALFHEAIAKNGSKTVLFCTASISSLYPKGFQDMLEMQAALGKKLNVPVAAAGRAWLTYWGDNPTPEERLALYDPDKAHPGKRGSYIYACALYAVLTGNSPVGLTNRLPKQPEDTITPADARKFQEAAWKVHQEINGKSSQINELKKLGARIQLDDQNRVIAVNLGERKVTDADLVHVQGLEHLQELDLTKTRITSAGLSNLKDLKTLKKLYLTDTRVDDAGIAQLKGMKSLETLGLSGTKISDAALEHLRDLTGLKALFCIGTAVTDAGVAKLQKAVPKCDVAH